MFGRITAVLVLAAAVLAVTAPAYAGNSTASCSVSPDPVATGTSYTVAVTGLDPGGSYWVTLKQGGTQYRYGQVADASGEISGTLQWAGTDGYGNPYPVWSPGAVGVSVTANVPSGRAADCQFTVT